ncbi:putative dynamin-like protein [Trypanosoma grayi]|uniref:putative dynamin-like protein n=1 Tax=Trypanosoma grayi TaxID=71804 RepID=UPI0004F46A56|nr:putative dynamin-like protein [Trypanosoma grayi]KEG07821.1 putative dynamin-like protein [Trypanosoma grayi]
MPSRKTSIAVAAGASIIAGAVTYYVVKRNSVKNAEDDDVFAAPVQVSGTADAASKEGGVLLTADTTTQGEKKVFEAVAKKGSGLTSVENKLISEALNELGMEQPSKGPAKPLATKAGAANNQSDKNRKEFPLLGLSLEVPPGWDVREDLSPFPNVAMITVWNQDLVAEDSQQMPGMVPMVILSVEDVRGDSVDLLEFKDRCKELAVNQMLMMTGGAIHPQVTVDSAVQTGPFHHVLEYSQSIPPFYDIAVLNLLEVRHSIAYTFQIMCAPSVMSKYRSTFMDMARNMRLAEKISTKLGHVELHTGAVKVDIDSTWSWTYPGKGGALAVFTTSSPIKKEEISLYTEETIPTTPHKPREEKTMDGVVIVTAYDGKQQQKTFTYNGYALVVKPLQKPTSHLLDEDLVAVVKSAAASTARPKPRNGGTFVNKEHGYRVDIVGGGRLVASLVGGGSAAYAPRGVGDGTNSEEQPPSVTIRVGSPENDPECMGSIEEWEARMQQESVENDIKEITRTTINGEPCLTFLSQSMEEIEPGKRVEVRGKVFIFVRNGKTTLIRWEMASGLWRKFEREMNTFVESLEFI